MLHEIRNSNPSTYNIKFFDNVDSFTIYDSKGGKYYYRYLPPGCTSIKVNIPDTGIYRFNTDAELRRERLVINPAVNRIKLPPRERNRRKDFYIVHDPNEIKSPALIYTETGKIVTGSKFNSLTIPMKVFVLLHELGHFDYHTEKYCDLFAFVEAMKMGYNASNCMYCLTDILRSNPANDERIFYIYNVLLQNEIIK